MSFGTNALFQNAPDTLGFIHVFEVEPDLGDTHDGGVVYGTKKKLRLKKKKVRKLLSKPRIDIPETPLQEPGLLTPPAQKELEELQVKLSEAMREIEYRSDQYRKIRKLAAEQAERLITSELKLLDEQEQLARNRELLITKMIKEVEDDALLILLLTS